MKNNYKKDSADILKILKRYFESKEAGKIFYDKGINSNISGQICAHLFIELEELLKQLQTLLKEENFVN